MVCPLVHLTCTDLCRYNFLYPSRMQWNLPVMVLHHFAAILRGSHLTSLIVLKLIFDQSRSQTVTLTCGVRQGSVLGSLLFVLYTMDEGSIIKRHDLENHCYADGTQLHFSYKPEDMDTLASAFIVCTCVQMSYEPGWNQTG